MLTLNYRNNDLFAPRSLNAWLDTRGSSQLASIFSHYEDAWDESNGIYQASFEVPGVKKELVNITSEDGYIKITIKDKAGNVVDHKSLIVPTYADANKIDAKLEDGILTLTTPRSEESKPKQILIK